MAGPIYSPADPAKLPGGNATSAAGGGLPQGRGGYFDLDGVSNALQTYAQGQKRNEDLAEGLRVSQAEDQFRVGLATKISALDPASDTYTKDVQQIVGDMTRDTIQSTGIKGQARQVQLQDALSRQGANALVASIDTQKTAIEKRTVQEFDRGGNEAVNQMIASPDKWDGIKAGFLQRMAPALDALPSDVRMKKVAQFLDDAVLMTSVGLADGKRFGEARKFLEANAGSIDPDKIVNTKYRIDHLEQEDINDKRAAAAAARQAQLDKLKAQKEQAELDAIRNGTADASNVPDGYFADGEHAEYLQELRTYATNQANATTAQLRANSEAISAFGAGQKLSPTEQKTVFNALVATQTRSAIAAGMPEGEAIQAAFGGAARMMIQQTGQVPEAITTRIASRSRSDDPNALAEAAQMDADIRATAGWANHMDTGLSDRGKLVSEIARERAGGADPTPDDFRQVAAEIGKTDMVLLDKRTKEGQLAFGGNPLTDFTKATGMTDPGAAQDWNQRRMAYYRQGVDVARAGELATAEIKRSYSTTYVGGERQVRGPAPEQAYPRDLRAAMGDDWVAKQISSEVTDLGKRVGLDTSKATLQPDEQTRMEAKSGKAPSYPVMVPDPNTPGLYKQAIVEKDGHLIPVRWTGPTSEADAWTQPGVAAELERRKGAAEAARVQRKEVLAPRPTGEDGIEMDPRKAAADAVQEDDGRAAKAATARELHTLGSD